jgi:hypothetical protein
MGLKKNRIPEAAGTYLKFVNLFQYDSLCNYFAFFS